MSLEGIDEEIASNAKSRDSLSNVVTKGGNTLSVLSKNKDLLKKKQQAISDMTKI